MPSLTYLHTKNLEIVPSNHKVSYNPLSYIIDLVCTATKKR